MDFFGIGAMELLLILVLALIVMGPRQLPQAARKLATLLRDLRRMWTELSRDFARELNVEEAMGEDLRTITDTVSSLRGRPSPASLLGGLVGSDAVIPSGRPPSPAKVLFGEEGAAGSQHSGATTTAAPQSTVPPQPAAPPQSTPSTAPVTASPPQEAAPAAPEAATPAASTEAASVPQEAAAEVQIDDGLEGDTASDG